jgi:hypothetical protein
MTLQLLHSEFPSEKNLQNLLSTASCVMHGLHSAGVSARNMQFQLQILEDFWPKYLGYTLEGATSLLFETNFSLPRVKSKIPRNIPGLTLGKQQVPW